MRSAWLLPFALLAGAACSDDDSKAPPASSGPFEGVAWVAPDRTGRLVVGWKASPAAAQYRVYASLHQGRPLKNAFVATTAATTLVIAPSAPGERHFVTVRAVDANGVEDGNVVERSAVAAPDTTPPQFAGARAVAPFANGGATVSWDPATDDASPPEAIAYDVYAGPTAQSLVPIGRAPLGATSLSVPLLGKPAEQFVFAVRARDVAENVSADAKTLAGPLGPDVIAPTFAGCENVTDVGSRSATVSWQPATDDHALAADLQYEVFAAFTAGGQDFTGAPLAKVKGATSIELKNLEPGKSYFLVCRVRDDAGNLDTNTNEKTAATSADVTPPSFEGLTNAVVDSIGRKVTLSWAAATDDKTDASKIVYDVYETKTPGVYDFTSPPKATSAPGATSLELTDLEPRSTLSWVVRARDEAKNRDVNQKEKSGDIATSFSINVQPIFTQSCAVVGCHVTGIAPAGLNLAPAFAYDQLVNALARLKQAQVPGKKRVAVGTADPLGDSFLYEKIQPNPSAGAQMPAPQTGSALTQLQKDIITSWILEGAPRN